MRLALFAFTILFCLQATCLEKDTLNIPSLTPVNAVTFGGYNTIHLVTGGKPNFAIAADLEIEKGFLEETKNDLTIGKGWGGVWFLKGDIGSVKIYDAPMSDKQVMELSKKYLDKK